MKLIGRKKTFTLVTLNSIAMFVAFYISNNANQLFYSEILQGMTHGSSVTVSVIVISEYTSPRYRGLFLTIKSATLLWGMWAANTIGAFFHWKYIPMCGMICSIFPLTVLIWPESPYWLATKGRYDECAAAHRWLKGSDPDSEKELETLMDSQIKTIKRERKVSLSLILKTVRLKEFYKPLLLSLLMAGQYHFSGKFVCSIYSIEIIKRITANDSAAYMGMLILDGVTVFSMYIGCGIAKILKRRTLLLNSSAVGISFLFIISGYLYSVKLQLIEENKYLSIFLLSCFSLSISLGPMIMATSIYGELVPLRFKSSCVITIAVVFNGLHATLLKGSPYIFKTLGLHGMFLFYGIAASIFTILIYKYLPETKDKTLQEIEEYFKDDKTEVKEKLFVKDEKM